MSNVRPPFARVDGRRISLSLVKLGPAHTRDPRCGRLPGAGGAGSSIVYLRGRLCSRPGEVGVLEPEVRLWVWVWVGRAWACVRTCVNVCMAGLTRIDFIYIYINQSNPRTALGA